MKLTFYRLDLAADSYLQRFKALKGISNSEVPTNIPVEKNFSML